MLALPLGAATGYLLTFAISAGFSTDLYQISSSFNPASYGIAILIVIASAVVSGWLVKRDIDRADLVTSLKTGE
jgi:putative ABC transport system permease protein